MIHRSFFNQLADYRFLARSYLRLSNGKKKEQLASRPRHNKLPKLQKDSQLTGPQGVSYFALHKLFYLAEYEFYRRMGRRMTAAYIVRQKEGPYVFEMHIKKLRKAISD